MVKKILLSLICLFPMAAVLSASSECCKYEHPTLALSAQATLSKPADELQMKIGVVTLNDTAESALSENSVRMQAVLKNLENQGLTKKEYETANFSIHPTYTPYPQNPPPNWRQTINGYEVSNSIFVHTSQMELAGKLIDAANAGGANSIENIRFTWHDPRVYWNEAVSAATTNAINDANAIATAAGVKLVRLVSISLQNSATASPPGNVYFAKAFSADVPIQPGEVTLTANVSIEYEISN